MTASRDRGSEAAAESPVAIVCGGGSLPFEVAQRAVERGRRVVLFPLRGWADQDRVAAYLHHWIKVGQIARLARIARHEGCRDMIFVGALVRPALGQLRPDFATLRLIPRLIGMFRGGDAHLLAGIASIFEEHGFRVISAHEIAPQILMPEGTLGRYQPGATDRADIARGLAFLQAAGPFDVGQAVVVANNRIMAVEAAEGTDQMLARFSDLRRSGQICLPDGTGVLVKAPKPGQDRRIDLPSIGPKTIESAARAGINGIAVVARSAIVAEAERIAQIADHEKLFVVGVRDEPSER